VKSRKPVEIDGNMLRAIFTRAVPPDTRPLLTRLLTSIQPVVRIGRKGLAFVGVRGKVEF
jgi:hypothetical protein